MGPALIPAKVAANDAPGRANAPDLARCGVAVTRRAPTPPGLRNDGTTVAFDAIQTLGRQASIAAHQFGLNFIDGPIVVYLVEASRRLFCLFSFFSFHSLTNLGCHFATNFVRWIFANV